MQRGDKPNFFYCPLAKYVIEGHKKFRLSAGAMRGL